MTEEEKRVIDFVVNAFGMYGGKMLEKITHNEIPWPEARKGYGDGIPSSDRAKRQDYHDMFGCFLQRQNA